jgi:drug/metabolite transporter (DMT)-like permease
MAEHKRPYPYFWLVAIVAGVLLVVARNLPHSGAQPTVIAVGVALGAAAFAMGMKRHQAWARRDRAIVQARGSEWPPPPKP